MDLETLMVPIYLFMIFVAPLWLILHYRSKRQVSQGLTDEEFNLLNELVDKADKMTQRIGTLESILDAESPEWRQRNDK
ncbi:envelope stress response membrane protein PspB [Shewanella sp.]|uniref:envelope stress response membrane protein PspB n=1 Tax=Shewanella sp. TaxID=50422 RepID=UPI003A97EEB8